MIDNDFWSWFLLCNFQGVQFSFHGFIIQVRSLDLSPVVLHDGALDLVFWYSTVLTESFC